MLLYFCSFKSHRGPLILFMATVGCENYNRTEEKSSCIERTEDLNTSLFFYIEDPYSSFYMSIYIQNDFIT